MRLPKLETIIICGLFITLWICSLFLARHHTYTALDTQLSECIKLKQVVDKTREFAMSQPNEVRVIFRNLGYNVTMTVDTTTSDTKP